MRRFHLLGALLLIPAVFFCAAVPGCGKKDEPKKPALPVAPVEPGAEEKKDTPVAKGKKEPIKPGDGVIKGKVTFEGAVPKLEEITALIKHENCQMAPAHEKVYQTWIVGKDKGVANVVVYLKAPAGKYFEVSDADKKRTEPAILDQPFCQFEPRVLTLMAGQKLKILNSAKYPHNTRYAGEPGKNPTASPIIPPGQSHEVTFNKAQAKPIPINCDFHKWMTGSVWVFDHPYSAVTKADGTFEIKNVPTNTEVLVFGWHEAKQNFYGGLQGEKMTPKSGENKLELKISP